MRLHVVQLGSKGTARIFHQFYHQIGHVQRSSGQYTRYVIFFLRLGPLWCCVQIMEFMLFGSQQQRKTYHAKQPPTPLATLKVYGRKRTSFQFTKNAFVQRNHWGHVRLPISYARQSLQYYKRRGLKLTHTLSMCLEQTHPKVTCVISQLGLHVSLVNWLDSSFDSYTFISSN